MTITTSQLRRAPPIIKIINRTGYLKSWYKARGTFMVELENLPGEFLKSIVISKKRIGVADNLWQFSCTLPVLTAQMMEKNPQRGGVLFQQLKREECLFEWKGLIKKTQNWSLKSQLFNQNTISDSESLIIQKLSENQNLEEYIRVIRPEKIFISISGGVIPPPREGSKKDHYLTNRLKLYQNPIECAWYTILTKNFHLTRKTSQIMEHLLLVMNSLIEIQNYITQKVLQELI
ncbi:MAG: hypothetical protein ACXAB7_20110 [Candidatus Kariarchaeaceae archaeon]|jgi:hypothetical protein